MRKINAAAHPRLRAIIGACIVSLFLAGCGGSPTSQESPNLPAITGLSPANVSPGDTLVVTGRNFSADLSADRVVFNGQPASVVPFAGDASRLECVVPETAFTGVVWVEVGGTRSNAVAVTVDRVVTILGVSAAEVAPGAQLEIFGRHFTPQAASNKVVFDNSLATATPTSASAETLVVTVPADAASGPLWVEVYGTKSDSVNMGIIRGVGDVWSVEAIDSLVGFKLKSTSGNEEFLLVPHFPLETADTLAYDVSTSGLSVYPSPATSPRRRGTPLGLQELFDVKLHEEAEELLGGRRVAPPLTTAERREGTPPATKTFYVLNTMTGSTLDPSNFTSVTATLRYTGRKSYVYSDVNMPPGGFSQADYDSFGVMFDNSIYPTDSTYFGPTTDIDSDGHVYILFTPVVNGITPPGTAQQNGFVAGFFLRNDLLPGIAPAGTSNGMEIFYSVVPDPNGVYGNVFTLTRIKQVVPNVLAHEVEHMISFGYRLFTYGANGLQPTWLEEGMAHMAEDVNGFDADNIARANLYLSPDPGAVSLMDDDTLEQRGAIYLFLRYLADRKGESILKRIVDDQPTGTAAIEAVMGEDFFATFADWLATLYLSNRGVTSDPTYNYSSIDLQAQFDPLAVTTRTFSSGSFADAVKAASGDFFVFQNPSLPGAEIRLDSPSSTSRIRAVVVRIK